MTSALYLHLSCVFVYFCVIDVIASYPVKCGKGYYGLLCTVPCRYPSYGKTCGSSCNCPKQFCSHVNGCSPPVFRCPPGFIGTYCESKCRFPNYGRSCQKLCLCSQEDCHFSNGCRRNIVVSVVNKEKLSTMNTLPETTLSTIIRNTQRAKPLTTFKNQRQNTETSLESMTKLLDAEKRTTCQGESSGLFPFCRNIGIKTSLVVFCILLISFVVAHVLLFIVKRIKLNGNRITV